MKKLFHLVLLIILLGMTTRSFTQDSTSDTYQVRVPTSNDYIILLYDMLARDPVDIQALQTVAQEITVFDYLSNNIPYDRLVATYTILDETLQYRIDHNYWVRSIIEAWLNLHPHELETNQNLSFDDFSVRIQAVDFLNDGQAEYILEIYRDRNIDDIYSSAYDAYMIAYIGDNGKYNVTETPSPMHYNLAGMGWQRDTWQTVHLSDVNADGKIEWVVYGYGHNTGPGAQARGRVLILVWNGTQLINIAPDAMGFGNRDINSVTWEYLNVDEDAAIEIIKTTRHHNSWGCSYSTRATFVWSIDQAVYILANEESIYPETVGCVVTEAETAMWDEDFSTALALYDRARTLAEESNFPDGWYTIDIEQFQYIQARHALAFALNGQADEALNQLQLLQSVVPASDGIAAIVELMIQAYVPEQDVVALCTALYNYFIPYKRDTDGYGYYSPVTAYVGFTLVDGEMFVLDAYTPATRDIACDIEWLIESRLGEPSISVDDLPSEVIESVGIPIREALHLDINQDDIEDWLLWVDAEIIPFAFISDKEMGIYHISRPELPTTIGQSDFTLFDLPENEGIVLAWLSFAAEYMPYYRGRCPSPQDLGLLTLWKLNDEFELGSFFAQEVCEQRTWNQLIQDDGRELHIWVQDGIDIGGNLIDAIYSWDNETKRYVLTQPPPEYWEEMRIEYFGEEPNLSAEISTVTHSLRNALLVSGELEANLSTLEEKLTGDTSHVDLTLIQRASYYQALAFESVGRSDEALATYIAIHESAPDTVWGMLAALHFEIIN